MALPNMRHRPYPKKHICVGLSHYKLSVRVPLPTILRNSDQNFGESDPITRLDVPPLSESM